jgi:hypothetical protein
MGFFGGYIFDGNDWLEFEPAEGTAPEVGSQWLKVVIIDSDIADISYHPAGPGTGVAYLGYTPRVYFEDETASAPTDVEREAAGLAAWVAAYQGGGDEAALQDLITPFLASDDDEEGAGQDDDEEDEGWGDEDEPDEDDEDEDEEDDDEDDDEAFVETKLVRLLSAIGLPLPDDLLAD